MNIKSGLFLLKVTIYKNVTIYTKSETLHKKYDFKQNVTSYTKNEFLHKK